MLPSLLQHLVSITVLVLAWVFVELVAKAVYMRVDLSLIGNHKGQIEPFRSAEEELASLDLVFKGLMVDIQWEGVEIREGIFGGIVGETKPIPNSMLGVVFNLNGKKFKVRLLVPKLEGLRLTAELVSDGIEFSETLSSYIFC